MLFAIKNWYIFINLARLVIMSELNDYYGTFFVEKKELSEELGVDIRICTKYPIFRQKYECIKVVRIKTSKHISVDFTVTIELGRAAVYRLEELEPSWQVIKTADSLPEIIRLAVTEVFKIKK